MTADEMLDHLEADVKKNGPLILHDMVTVDALQFRGLGLLGGRRTLRQAIAHFAGVKYDAE